MANFCENCGSPLKSENKFCPNCGAPIKQTEATAPATATTPNSFPENASANTSPANAPTGNPSTTSAISDTSSAVSGVAGAATAATLGAIHPDPVPEKPQDAFLRILLCDRKPNRPLHILISSTKKNLPGAEQAPNTNRTKTCSPCSCVTTTA